MRVARFIGICGIIAMLACDGESSPTPTSPTGAPTIPTSTPAGTVDTITIQDFSFTPATITVKVGTVVHWVNAGPSPHTTTSDMGTWESGILSPPLRGVSGGSFEVAFDQVGTFPFHCSIHPPSRFPGFVGSVVVTQ